MSMNVCYRTAPMVQITTKPGPRRTLNIGKLFSAMGAAERPPMCCQPAGTLLALT